MGATPVFLLALLQCSALAWAQTPKCAAETELNLLYKAFAQNENAFNTFLDLLPVRPELLAITLTIIIAGNYNLLADCRHAGTHRSQNEEPIPVLARQE